MKLFNRIINGQVDPRVKELKQFSLLNRLDDTELGFFAQMLLERQYKKDEIIFKAGYPHVVMFLVRQGEVDIVKADSDIVLAELKPGHHFGEIGMFREVNRTATAIAREATSLWGVSKDDFNNFLETHPQAGVKLLFNIAASLSGHLIVTDERVQ